MQLKLVAFEMQCIVFVIALYSHTIHCPTIRTVRYGTTQPPVQQCNAMQYNYYISNILLIKGEEGKKGSRGELGDQVCN